VNKARVLLANDHRVLPDMVCAFLPEEFDVVGTANNGEEAVDQIQRLDPEVLVMDVSMPVLDGLKEVSRFHSGGRRQKLQFLRHCCDRHARSSYYSYEPSRGFVQGFAKARPRNLEMRECDTEAVTIDQTRQAAAPSRVCQFSCRRNCISVELTLGFYRRAGCSEPGSSFWKESKEPDTSSVGLRP
jgi:chemotaxis response regulator CheB